MFHDLDYLVYPVCRITLDILEKFKILKLKAYTRIVGIVVLTVRCIT